MTREEKENTQMFWW